MIFLENPLLLNQENVSRPFSAMIIPKMTHVRYLPQKGTFLRVT